MTASIKKNNIWITVALVIASLAVIGGIIFMVVYFTSSKSNKYSSENVTGVKYISERSFSLKFDGATNGNNLIGTGWLMAQDKTDTNQYYFGTNLHVASALNNINKRETYDYINNGINNGYLPMTQSDYKYLSFGQITSIFDNNYEVGILPDAKKYEQNYYSRIDIKYANVAWTTFDIFNSMNFSDPFKVYNQNTIQNGTMDFAVIKVDFSYLEELSNITPPGNLPNINEKPMQKALNQFHKEPTKFANEFVDNEAITVGGFPVKSGSAQWESTNNVYSNKKYYGLVLDRTNWRHNIDVNISDEKIKKDYSLETDIKYITDQYASQRNVANQVLFENLNLVAGASGSMAINSKNEIVGIYWGTYGTSDGREIGAIDLFKSFSNSTVKTKIKDYTNQQNEYIISNPYNIISKFNEQFNTNLK